MKNLKKIKKEISSLTADIPYMSIHTAFKAVERIQYLTQLAPETRKPINFKTKKNEN